MQIEFDILHGNKKLNHALHAWDLFEEGKQLFQFKRLQVTCDKTVDELPDLITKLKETISQEENVIFISIRSVDRKINSTIPPYIQQGVQTVSDGGKFDLFKNILEQLGYTVTTNEFVMVLTATLQ